MEYLGIKLELSPIPVSNVHWLLFQNEFWKWVPKFESWYLISSLGRVKSYRKDGSWKYLSICYNKAKYPFVGLRRKPLSRTVFIHRVVLESFKGLSTDTSMTHINHINSNKEDNRLVNLEWTNNRENNSHKVLKLKKESIYTGVSKGRDRYRWRACIGIGKKTIYIGTYDTEIEASQAYKDAMVKYNIVNKYAVTV